MIYSIASYIASRRERGSLYLVTELASDCQVIINDTGSSLEENTAGYTRTVYIAIKTVFKLVCSFCTGIINLYMAIGRFNYYHTGWILVSNITEPSNYVSQTYSTWIVDIHTIFQQYAIFLKIIHT